MQGHFDTSFFYQFFILFQLVPSVLLSMVALITTYMRESDLIERISTNQKMVYRATMESKTEGTT